MSSFSISARSTTTVSTTVATQTQGIRAGDGSGVRTPETRPGKPRDSFTKAGDKPKASKAGGSKRKDKAGFKQDAQKTSGATKTQHSTQSVQGCFHAASSGMGNAVGDFSKQMSGCLQKGDVQGLMGLSERFGEALGGIRKQLGSDLRQSLAGQGAGPDAAPAGKAQGPGASSQSGQGPGASSQGAQGPGASSQGAQGPGGIEAQLKDLIGQLTQLLQGLQGLMGKQGCSAGQQDQALENVAQGAGTPVPKGSPANQSIQAVSSSFSALSSSFSMASTSSDLMQRQSLMMAHSSASLTSQQKSLVQS